jgi:hypothetical protein
MPSRFDDKKTQSAQPFLAQDYPQDADLKQQDSKNTHKHTHPNTKKYLPETPSGSNPIQYAFQYIPGWGVQTWDIQDIKTGRSYRAKNGWPKNFSTETFVRVLGTDEEFYYLFIPNFGGGAFTQHNSLHGGALISCILRYHPEKDIPIEMVPKRFRPKEQSKGFLLLRIYKRMQSIPGRAGKALMLKSGDRKSSQ